MYITHSCLLLNSKIKYMRSRIKKYMHSSLDYFIYNYDKKLERFFFSHILFFQKRFYARTCINDQYLCKLLYHHKYVFILYIYVCTHFFSTYF